MDIVDVWANPTTIEGVSLIVKFTVPKYIEYGARAIHNNPTLKENYYQYRSLIT